jgi:hypothetical protein
MTRTGNQPRDGDIDELFARRLEQPRVTFKGVEKGFGSQIGMV